MLGFLGGTGREGRGLALRFASLGYNVMIGSRDLCKAKMTAEGISEFGLPGFVRSGLNGDVAQRSDIAFLTIPYSVQIETLSSLKKPLAGKLVVSTVVPLKFLNGQAISEIVSEGSAALQAQSILTDSTVVAAFHNIDAKQLLSVSEIIDSDVIVCSNDEPSKTQIMELAEKIEDIRAIDGGGLQNSRYVEDLTALLANINIIYKAHSTIKIVGL